MAHGPAHLFGPARGPRRLNTAAPPLESASLCPGRPCELDETTAPRTSPACLLSTGGSRHLYGPSGPWTLGSDHAAGGWCAR